MKGLLLFFCGLLPWGIFAESIQSLDQCIEYALSHHLPTKQAVLQEQQAALTLKQSKMAFLPNANFTLGNGLQGGKNSSVDNSGFVETIQTYGNLGLQSNAEVFNFGNKHFTLKANLNHWLAQKSNTEKIAIELKISVVQAYLQAVLSWQQILLNQAQMEQTKRHLLQMQKNYALGNIAETNLIEIEAQLARDSLQNLNAWQTYQDNILQLKSTMTYPLQDSISLQPIEVNIADLLFMAQQSPEEVYQKALSKWASIRFQEYKIKALTYSIKALKTKILPSINISATVANNVIYSPTLAKSIGEGNLSTANLPIGFWKEPTSQQSIPVFNLQSTSFYENYRSPNLWDQFKNNYNYTLLLNISVPIFQGWNNRNQIKNQEYNLQNQNLQKEYEALKLQQSIYQVWTLAKHAYQKWQASLIAENLASKSYQFADKKMSMGNITVTEFLSLQNLYQKSKLESLLAQYDCVFKHYVLKIYEME